ncbi:MAG: hypothetical protein IJM65_05725 [Bacteroidales bacterium]|nr:hypothetical protein [Bacteroidales bacterium]
MDKLLKTCGVIEKAEVACLFLLPLCLPLSWRWASYVMAAMCVVGCAKAFCRRRILPEGGFRRALPYLLFSATFFCYLLSVLWSDNSHEAWRMVDKKLPFLLLPICFLISQPVLDGHRVRNILRLFTGSVLAVFAANLVLALYDIAHGAPFHRMLNENLMVLFSLHHTYMSMYACLCIAFCLFAPAEGRPRLLLRIVSLLMLSLFVLLLESRAGLLCMSSLYVVFCLWLILAKRRRLAGFSLAALLLAAVVAAGCLVPGSFDRVAQTVRSLFSETEPDCRMVQREAYHPLLGESGLFGLGGGDRIPAYAACFRRSRDSLLLQVKPTPDADLSVFESERNACMDSLQARLYFYSDFDNSSDIARFAGKYHCDSASVRRVLYRYLVLSDAIEMEFNAHNQYEDTLVAVGWVGLALLLFYFIFPVAVMWRSRGWDPLLCSLLWIVAFNALFESVLEKQSGILFFLYFLLIFYQKNVCIGPIHKSEGHPAGGESLPA